MIKKNNVYMGTMPVAWGAEKKSKTLHLVLLMNVI